MLIDGINLNYLRIFQVVYRTRSMTLAAKELHMTQSGVSQHVKTLESMLQASLFDRIQKRLIPTAKATILYARCESGLIELETGLGEIKEHSREHAGTISVGMPIEFGNGILLPRIGKFCRENPKVNFRFRIALAPRINELLTQGELDFAFVDDFTPDPKISTENVYNEILNLYAHENLLKKSAPKKNPKELLRYFESLPYVEYQESGPALHAWFSHHLRAKNPKLLIRATILDVQGVARLISAGVGAGVLPSHVAERMVAQGARLQSFQVNEKPLKNAISLALLKGRSHSPAALAMIASLKSALREVRQQRVPG